MFREDKATQMAARFLTLAGGELNYLLLMKMLYIADKAKLLERGSPVTGDDWFSMKNGPILSRTLDLIRHKVGGDYWPKYIETDTDSFEASLLADPGVGALSPLEQKIIEQTYEEWGHLDEFVAADATHDPTKFPEYTDPGPGRIPIEYHEVLKLNGVEGVDVANILDDLWHQDIMNELSRAK